MANIKQDINMVRKAPDIETKYNLGDISTTEKRVTKLEDDISVDKRLSLSSNRPVANKVITEALSTKVSTTSGKGLSTNDFTDTYKTNVDNNTTARHTHNNKLVLDGINSTDITNWNNKSTFSGSYNDLTNKPTIPDELSDLSDDTTHRLVTDTEKSAWNNKSDHKYYYGECNTSASTKDKVVSCSGFVLEDGVHISVYFENGQDAITSGSGTITLNVNNTGAKSISYCNYKIPRYVWKEGETIDFTYIATDDMWLIHKDGIADTTYYGLTKLSSSTSSTSESLSATPKAVKQTYDLANSKQDILVSGTNIKTINGNNILGSGDISLGEASTLETYGLDYDLDDIKAINSTSNTYFIDIKNAIDNGRPFRISIEDLDSGDMRYVVIKNYEHLEHYLGQPESYSFWYTNEDVLTKITFTISGTSITTTSTSYSKQDNLVSGTNIKTINGNSILGSGDLAIGSSGIDYVTEIDNDGTWAWRKWYSGWVELYAYHQFSGLNLTSSSAGTYYGPSQVIDLPFALTEFFYANGQEVSTRSSGVYVYDISLTNNNTKVSTQFRAHASSTNVLCGVKFYILGKYR